MSRKILVFVMVAAASLLIVSCGEPAANNAANKPANAANNTAANTTSSASAEADIKKTMADLATALAKNDADAAAKFYSDDYHLVTAEGVDQDKTARIADMRSGATKFESFTYENIKVRAYGDTAVAICNVKLSGTVSGKAQSGDIIATLVFRKLTDGWKVVSGQATRIGAAAAPANSAANTANTSANKSAESAANAPANK